MPILKLNRFEKPIRQAFRSLFFLFLGIALSQQSKAQLKAAFSFDKPASCISVGQAGISVTFNNLSTGGVFTSEWTFGSLGRSIQTNPTWTFDQPGVYYINLTIKNNANETDAVTQVLVIYPAPQITFDADVRSGCAPLGVIFRDLTTIGQVTDPTNGTIYRDNIISRFWDFGEGNTTSNNAAVVNYIYSNPGTKRIRLTLKTESGCEAIGQSAANYITIFNRLEAGFYLAPANVCQFPFVAKPINSSLNAETYLWTASGNTPVTISNPTAAEPDLIFTQAGTYRITLKVSNSNGCSNEFPFDFNVPAPQVKSDFTGPLVGCSQSNILFTNGSQPDASLNIWFVNGSEVSRSKNLNQYFDQAGNYNVRLESQIGTCLIVTQKTVTINPLPIPDFVADKVSNCAAPFDVTFTDNSTGSVLTRTWNFGDGTTVTQGAPFASRLVTHRYTTLGRFSVSLTTINSFGCSKEKRVDDMIILSPPAILRTNLPDSGCAPLTIKPDVRFVNPLEVQSWLWNVTNASGTIVYSSTLEVPDAFQLNSAGIYKVNLDVRSPLGCISKYNWDVKVGVSPAPFDFTVSPADACASQLFSFNYVGPDATGYKWKFNDGDSSLEKNVSRQFKMLGKYDVSLTVYGNGCAKTLTKPQFVNVRGVIAIFNSLLDCSKPLERNIRDLSVGNIQKWEWDFGDGTQDVYTTAKPNFVHTYTQSGLYSITLKVSGDGCTYSDTLKFRVSNESKIDLLSLVNPICISDTFLNLKAVVDDVTMIKSFDWDFGCGFTGQTGDTAKKIDISTLCKYSDNAKRGLYSMQIRIIDTNNCVYQSPVKDFFVGGSITDYIPLTPLSGCSNLPVKFQDATSGDGTYDILERIWDFGDGTPPVNIIDGPIEHIFANAGSFDVRLTTKDSRGCISTIQKVAVKTSNPGVDFFTNQQSSCLDRAVQFEATNQTSLSSYQWDLGEGQVSFIASPRAFYKTTGKKTVSLRVRDNLGCESFLTKQEYVLVDMPASSFTVNKDTADCPPFTAVFSFTGKYVERFEWDFGDGSTSSLQDPSRLYTLPGSYPVNLKVISPGGCEATSVTLPIVVLGPVGTAKFNPYACEPFIAEFRVSSLNAAQVKIDYGNGLISPALPYDTLFKYQYADTGTYRPKIFFINDRGCQAFVPGTGSIRVVEVRPNFRVDKNFFCDEGTVKLTDLSLSNDSFIDWIWDFGDGNTGVGKTTSHFYSKPGIYSVKLRSTTQFGCTDSLVKPQLIEIQSRPDMGITQSRQLICEDDQVQFNAVELSPTNSPVAQWFWDFTNGNSSTLKLPPIQQFRKTGIYPIRLYAANDKGCWDTVFLDLNVNAIPKLEAGADTYLCLGTAIQLNPTGADNYEWFGSSLLSCSNCSQPFINPDQDAIYFVRGTSSAGCSTVDSIKVKVISPQTLIAPLDTFVCFGGSVKLQASGTDSYRWSPALGLNKLDIPDPVAKPDQTTVYTVTGRDAFNCFSSSRKVNVRVIPNPIVDAGADTTVKAGYPVRLEPTYSADVTRIQWVPAQFLNCADCRNPVATLSYSTTYTVFVYTKEGCVSKDVVNVLATCTKENIFIPNTFSPNGDGYNEIFYPRSRGVERIKSMKIFSRWGQLVYVKDNFLANDQLSGWDGKRIGAYVTPDVYVYMIDLLCENGTIITIKGDVTLVR
ncbi:MAG: hypothetical protein RL411_150, partial [Bacteroidota bacterium]